MSRYRSWSNDLSSHGKVDFVGRDVKELELWFKDLFLQFSSTFMSVN